MKNKIIFSVILMFAVAQMGFAPKPIQKLGRGVEGILTSPIEYLNEYLESHQNRESIPASLVTAAVMGTAMTVKRIINGVYDIVTFPIPYPRPYRLLWKDPAETALQDYYSLVNPELP